MGLPMSAKYETSGSLAVKVRLGVKTSCLAFCLYHRFLFHKPSSPTTTSLQGLVCLQ